MSDCISGIYKIINPQNNYIYIGSAKKLTMRWGQHLQRLKKNNHFNIHLQRAFNKRIDDFIFEIVECCELRDLVVREQFYIDTLKPEYNISPTAFSSLGIVRRDETKEKLRQLNLGKTLSNETKEKISQSNTGKKRSTKIKKIYSENQKGNNNSLIKSGKGFDIQIEAMRKTNLGKNRKEETCKKISISHSKPIVQLTLDDDFVRYWDSATHVERELGFGNSNINRVCSGKINKKGWKALTSNGFKWKFKKDYDK